ncbi:MAG: lytic transglycosylase domain-containing protein [Armatimonadetes bacterium]|nr:lytic transglycosylase domain-containing protein [Armatimonadota bacterium]MDW8121081.1 lytic transglycosylase domain-containing protein [Armatimonadota bacterium]
MRGWVVRVVVVLLAQGTLFPQEKTPTGGLFKVEGRVSGMIVGLSRVTLSVVSEGQAVTYIHIPLGKSPNWLRVGSEVTALCSTKETELWVEEINPYSPEKIVVPQETIVRVLASPPLNRGESEMGLGDLTSKSGTGHPMQQAFGPVVVSPLELEVQRLLPHYAAGVRFFNPSLPSHQAEGIAAALLRSSLRYGVDPRLMVALIACESSFRPDAVGKKGEIGLGQLLPRTAQALGVDPKDVVQNIDGSVRYLKTQLDRFGRVDWALAAYNAGPTAVIKAGGIPQNPITPRYVARVLLLYRSLCGQ